MSFQFEPFIRCDTEQLGAVASLDAVVAFFQFATTGSLSISSEALRSSFGALAYPLTLEYEVVPPDFAACGTIDAHRSISPLRIRLIPFFTRRRFGFFLSARNFFP